jgi:hypothetical protein
VKCLGHEDVLRGELKVFDPNGPSTRIAWTRRRSKISARSAVQTVVEPDKPDKRTTIGS